MASPGDGLYIIRRKISLEVTLKSREEHLVLHVFIPMQRAAGFSYTKRERNHCKQLGILFMFGQQLSAFSSSMCKFVTPYVMPLMLIPFVNFLLEVFRYKKCKFRSKIR